MLNRLRFHLMTKKQVLEADHGDSQRCLDRLEEHLGPDTYVYFRETNCSTDLLLLEPFVDGRQAFYLVHAAWAPDHNCIRSYQ